MSKLNYFDYNANSFGLVGLNKVGQNKDEKNLIKELRILSARWNSKMKGGEGWLFPREREEQLIEIIRKCNMQVLKIESEKKKLNDINVKKVNAMKDINELENIKDSKALEVNKNISKKSNLLNLMDLDSDDEKESIKSSNHSSIEESSKKTIKKNILSYFRT